MTAATGGSVGVAPPRRSTLRAWLALLRIHFIPLSLTAGLVGVAAAADGPTFLSLALGLGMCLAGYPFGVLINDVLDREADAINAPDRPLVTGEVSVRTVIVVCALLGGGFTIAAAIVVPSVAIWSAIAIAGHFLYQATKGTPLVGNVVNGLDMALFCVIGAAAAAPDRGWLDVPSAVWWDWAMIAILLNGFCLVGYFKDIPGDEVAGYRTLPVAIGARRARWFTIPSPIAAVAIGFVLIATDPGALAADGSTAAFWVFGVAAAIAFAISLRHIVGKPETHAYESLVWFTRGTVLFSLALGAAANPTLFLAVAAPILVLLEASLRHTQRSRQA
jgi:geranylgeranylglycerol-phosphate geranylgeranyltransferase